MPDLFILGAGGHAREVADIACELGYRPIFATHRRDEIERWPHGDEIVAEADALAVDGRRYAIGIGDVAARAAIARRLGDRALAFPTLIHPAATFGRGARAAAEAAQGSVIFAGARVSTAVRLGDFVVLNLNASVSHDGEIGDYANLSPGACVAGNVTVGEGAWIGAGAVINQGMPERRRSIGAWSVVGSGAVVTDDCEPHTTYVGVPARRIR